MFSIHDEEKLKNFLKENKIPFFRHAQIENAIYKNFVDSFDEIQTIPKDLRESLNKNTFYYSLKLDSKLDSDNWQTTKLLFKTKDWLFIESVIMRHLTWRNTLCISSQAGCPMWCIFCSTWKLGLQRNLEFYEIIEQVYYTANLFYKEWKVLRNVVYMWMWEPFLNYENVKKSINIICEQKKLNLSNRRVTISSCGIIEWIEKFAVDFPQTSLAISLHAPNDEIRNKLMPINKKNNLNDLLKVLDLYVEKTNKRIFYEYIMISWVNDNIKLAYELWELLKWKLAHVNFIPYNSWEWTWWTYKPTSRLIIEKFQKILEKFSIPSTIRATMGDDINAACWQLAVKNVKK